MDLTSYANVRTTLLQVLRCTKSVQVRSFFWSVFSCFRSEHRKIWTRRNPYLDNFHAVLHLVKKGFIRHYLKLLLSLTDLQQLRFNILQVKGYQDGMTITYLLDVIALVSLITVLCVKGINLYLQTEIDKLFFVFD